MVTVEQRLEHGGKQIVTTHPDTLIGLRPTTTTTTRGGRMRPSRPVDDLDDVDACAPWGGVYIRSEAKEGGVVKSDIDPGSSVFFLL